ncbi:MAG: MotA/TolQ/ExbB proton channel family protein [Pseudomonadota bacterium]|jgi:biopolymer transport protein ExbB
MWELFQAGGPIMWPILVLSVVSLTILVERALALQPAKVLPPALLGLVQSGQGPTDATAAGDSPLGQVVAAALDNRHRDRALLKEAVEDTGRHVAHELERYLNLLGTIAAVSPLLGLLGTVIGIITAFSAITHSGIGDPKALSGGIGQALVSTASGLIVAIPSLMGYRYLRGHVDGLVIQMEKAALGLIARIDASREQEGRVP